MAAQQQKIDIKAEKMNYCLYSQDNLDEELMIELRLLFHLSRQMSGLQLLGAVVIWLMVSTYGLADKIVLTDGDIIEGVQCKY